MRRFFYYFGWTVGIGILIYSGAKFQFLLKQDYMKNFGAGSYIVFSSIFPVVIGILLRLPKLINEIKASRQWSFDWTKFLGIGLPSFCILSMYVLIFTPVRGSILPFVPEMIYMGNSTIQIIAGVVFGFILFDSVKVQRTNE